MPQFKYFLKSIYRLYARDEEVGQAGRERTSILSSTHISNDDSPDECSGQSAGVLVQERRWQIVKSKSNLY